MIYLLTALAPVFIILIYVYFRDKYEREPLKLLLKAIIAGCLVVIPVIFIGRLLDSLWSPLDNVSDAAYNAFVIAAFTEELFKFLALYLLIWKNPNFNEKFDGIVYAVFISLGFAAVENVMYVSGGAGNVALIRAFTAVPAHAIFGIRMGYFFGIAHMYPELRKSYLRKALLYPILLHGIYDFILMVEIPWLLTLFAPYLVYLYYSGFRKMKIISDTSIYRPDEEPESV